MPTLQSALDGLTAALTQRGEVKRFQQAKARIAADPEASRALHAFITECYTRMRIAGTGAPTPADANWLSARRQVACQNPLVKEYIDCQEAVMRLLGTLQTGLNDRVVQPSH